MEASTTHSSNKELRIGEWSVQPASGQITRNGETARLEERSMRLLMCLAERPGELISINELLEKVWSGVYVTPDSVYQAVASLRRLLGDDPKNPAYIATVPRLGYRMIARVSREGESAVTAADHPVGRHAAGGRFQSEGSSIRMIAAAILASAAAGGLWLALAYRGQATRGNGSTSSISAAGQQPQESIAVLPFLDLTQGMREEEFADGMTEELIDKLSNIAGLKVPSATASFYFKGKQVAVADIARTLGVVYVLDGSTRKSNGRLRVAVRLMRAENGYVIWTETYDRPWNDRVQLQDEIAGEVTKALKTSIEHGNEHQ